MYFYESGTSTMKNTYSDADGLTTNSNPVILDSRGEADVFLDRDPYKVVVLDSNDVTILTRDDYHGYLQEDDGFGANLLINSEARVNENGYVSGAALSVGDDLFDKWECSATGTVTFTAGGSITLSAGTRIRQTNDDITALNGKEVTCFLQDSGSVTVNGLGLSSATVISVGNPVTFIIDTSSSAYLELGSGSAETYSGLRLTLGSAATNCPRRPVLVEQFITRDYMEDIVSNSERISSVISGHGVISRSSFEYAGSYSILVTGGAYRITTSTFDKVVNISSSGITVNGDFLLFSNNIVYLYIVATGVSSTNDITTSSQLLLKSASPSIDQSKNGWYNGDDRCIGAFYLDASQYIIKFFNSNGLNTIDSSGTDNYFFSFPMSSGASSTKDLAIPYGISVIDLYIQLFAYGSTGFASLNFDTDSAHSTTKGPNLYVNSDSTRAMYNHTSYRAVIRGRHLNTIYMSYADDGTTGGQAQIFCTGYEFDSLI